jgi:choline dehydrogenase-like flavoprotein
VLRPEVQESHRLPNHYVFPRPGSGPQVLPNALLMSFLGVRGALDLSPRQVWAMLADGYIRRRVLHQQLGLGSRSRWGDLFFMGEQLPDPASRVGRSAVAVDGFGYPRAEVDWRLGGADFEAFAAYLDVLLPALGQGAEVRSVRRDAMADWPRLVSSAAHHLGTARMAISPAAGVVDSGLKLFGGANVFVCDGSVFPTAGSVNPSLTIVALGLRLGEDLAARWLARPSLSAAAA